MNIDVLTAIEQGAEPVSKISLALCGLQPNQRRRKEKEFEAHYDEIVALVELGVSYKDLRSALAKGGLSMSAATFKKMFEAEKRRRVQPDSDCGRLAGGAA